MLDVQLTNMKSLKGTTDKLAFTFIVVVFITVHIERTKKLSEGFAHFPSLIHETELYTVHFSFISAIYLLSLSCSHCKICSLGVILKRAVEQRVSQFFPSTSLPYHTYLHLRHKM